MKGKNRRRVLGVVVSFLALVGVGASATYYVYEPANDGFLKYPTIVFLHVVFGGLYLAFAGLQFVGRVRSGRPGYHRWAGRALVSTGVVVGATGLFMGLVIPFSGWIERAYIGVFGTLFLVALVKGFVHRRAERVALHREWMIRAFAVALAIATMRVIFIPALASWATRRTSRSRRFRPRRSWRLSSCTPCWRRSRSALPAEPGSRRSPRPEPPERCRGRAATEPDLHAGHTPTPMRPVES